MNATHGAMVMSMTETTTMNGKIETIISVPPGAVSQDYSKVGANIIFAASDPPGSQLGSGGGTANILYEAWQSTRQNNASFNDWLNTTRKLIIHGSGQSRRLPAYAAESKLMLPLPLFPSMKGQHPDQRLINLQENSCRHIVRHAPDSYRMIVACGDTLVTSPDAMPIFPQVDVLIAGISASPEEARNHGVIFCPVDNPQTLTFFLQKPSVEEINKLSVKYNYFLDTGVWLFSARAVEVLMKKCGWDIEKECFADGKCGYYELFDKFGTALGEIAQSKDPEINQLTCAVLPLHSGKFFHFGTNRSVLNSVAQLSHPAEDRRAYGHSFGDKTQNTVILHSTVKANISNCHNLWIENSIIPESWNLIGSNVITGINCEIQNVNLPLGACIDLCGVIGSSDSALRIYGFDDTFKGNIEDPLTLFLGIPMCDWFKARDLDPCELGFSGDIQNVPLFPLVKSPEAMSKLIAWFTINPTDNEARNIWLQSIRVSATDLVQTCDLTKRTAQRKQLIKEQIANLSESQLLELFQIADLNALAQLNVDIQIKKLEQSNSSLPLVHAYMYEAAKNNDEELTNKAFNTLRKLMIDDMALKKVRPVRNILDDQIIWGRSPARLDFAGGWSDTPPFCLENGGRVLNVSVNLNGQPPIQTFVRICTTPHIVIRSIDLGIAETIKTYEELTSTSELGGFSIARAALRLSGFDPNFHVNGGYESLEKQLMTEFGGGIELSMLAAIPKGSGLGTSSILSATILGVLGEVCSHNWSPNEIFARTSVLEQILSSGGGWQDQVGGIYPSLKLTTTRPDLSQLPDVHWLPEKVFAEAIRSGRAMLYYTGITRVARNILSEIVKSIFLNKAETMSIINDISLNATFIAEALQRNDPASFEEGIHRSWQLNRELDKGTCPPAIKEILDQIAPFKPSCKLLGAGGGGYMLILAKDTASAAAIRESLTTYAPNSRARFVDMEISHTGLQITRS